MSTFQRRWLRPGVKLAVCLALGLSVGCGQSPRPPEGTATPREGAAPAATHTTDDVRVTQEPATAAPGAAASREHDVFVIDAASTRLTYAVDQVWLGEGNRLETVTGLNSQVAGQMTLDYQDPTDSILGVFSADLSGFISGNAERDQALRKMWQDSGRFSLATFVGSELRDFPDHAQEGELISFQLAGNLTLVGAARPVTWDVTATLDEDRLHGEAVTHIELSDYGLPAPEVAGVLSASQGVTVTLNFAFIADSSRPASGHG